VTRAGGGPFRGGAVVGAALVGLLSGCPPAASPQSAASAKAAETADVALPSEPGELVPFADRQFKAQTAAGMRASIAALERAQGAGVDPKELAWRSARAHAWLVEELEADEDRLRHAEAGVAAGQEAVRLDPGRVEAQYYLGLSKAEYVNVKKDKARAELPGLVTIAKEAVRLDEKYDEGGPLRLLGSVYAQAPEPPISVGDHQEGIELLQRAVKLAGGHPENHLLLGDALRVDKQMAAAEREYGIVLGMPFSEAYGRRLPRWQAQAQQGLSKIRNLRNTRKGTGDVNPF
jgi:tetratricopeptide (TPR) repeat protein